MRTVHRVPPILAVVLAGLLSTTACAGLLPGLPPAGTPTPVPTDAATPAPTSEDTSLPTTGDTVAPATPSAPAPVEATTSPAPDPTIAQGGLSSIAFTDLCGMSGTLTDGKYRQGEGQEVWLLPEFTAAGTYAPGQTGTVAALQCTSSGTASGTSTHLLLLDAAGQVVDRIDVGEHLEGFSPGLHEVSLSDGVLTVRVDRIVQENECQTCGTKDAVLTFAWDPATQAVVLTDRTAYTEATAAAELVSALNDRDTARARKYASDSVLSTVEGGSQYLLASCVTESFGEEYRTCTIEYMKNEQNAGAHLSMQRTGFATWQAVKAEEFWWYA